jgi:hypothetical protein
VRAVLTAGGRFVFNVPEGFLADGAGHRPPERYPPLWREMRAIAERDFGWTPRDRPPGRAGQRLSRKSIRHDLQAAGFDVEQVTEISYPASAGSQRAWLSIPVFTRDWLPGLPYADRLRVLDKACERLGSGLAEEAPWVVWLARAGGAG